jgi:hypothetical protein
MKILSTLERKFRPLAIHNLTFLLIAVQVSCLVGGLFQPSLLELLSLYPDKVLEGEVWRIATFLAVPTVQHPLWAFFFYYLFYLMGTALERLWGDFRYTLYLLIGYVATVSVAILGGCFLDADVPASNAFLEGSVFLAFAWIYPDFELLIMFILPVKVKWMALLAWVGYAFMFITGLTTFQQGGWLLSLTIVASVGNFVLFFGPELIGDLRARRRRTMWARQLAEKPNVPRHCCAICGITNLSHPKMDFRYCTKCADHPAYCQDHLRNHEHRQAS